MKNQNKAYLFALLSVLLWSTVSTAFKIALNGIDNFQLLFISITTTFLITLVIIIYNGKIKTLYKLDKKEYYKSAIYGLLNPFGYYIILFKAYSLLPAQVAQPLNYTWPVVLVLLSVPILKQKLKFQSIIALVISFLGVLIIASQGKLSSLKVTEPLGIILATSSSIIWSLYWLLSAKDKLDEILRLFLNFSFGLIYICIIMLLFSDFKFNFDKHFFAGIYVGFFEMGITFIIWLKALKNSITSDKISNLIYLSPVLALFFISIILKEKIYYTTYIGLGFILLSVFVLNIKTKNA